jgi:uncharacterized protein with FMN-binding domain
MRKTITILIVVTLLGIVAAYEVPAGGKKQTSSGSSTQTTPQTSSSTPTASSSQSQTAASGTLKSGTYTGTTATNPYDEIQVAITVSGGKITSITTPVLTGDTGRSDEINSYAVPQLTKQALSSQSTQIDGVSGASYTTQSYTESLQSAIDQAKA